MYLTINPEAESIIDTTIRATPGHYIFFPQLVHIAGYVWASFKFDLTALATMSTSAATQIAINRVPIFGLQEFVDLGLVSLIVSFNFHTSIMYHSPRNLKQ